MDDAGKMTREEATTMLKDLWRYEHTEYTDKEVRTALDMAITALEQEPKFLAKSDGTIEQIKDCEDCLFKKEWEKIGKLISVVLEKQTEKEINGDYISREKTLGKFCDYVGSGMSMNDFDALYDIVVKMPSVQSKAEQEPKIGHWIDHTQNGITYMECSKCSSWFLRQYLTRNSYCPNCGAKMVESQESEEE